MLAAVPSRTIARQCLRRAETPVPSVADQTAVQLAIASANVMVAGQARGGLVGDDGVDPIAKPGFCPESLASARLAISSRLNTADSTVFPGFRSPNNTLMAGWSFDTSSLLSG